MFCKLRNCDKPVAVVKDQPCRLCHMHLVRDRQYQKRRYQKRKHTDSASTSPTSNFGATASSSAQAEVTTVKMKRHTKQAARVVQDIVSHNPNHQTITTTTLRQETESTELHSVTYKIQHVFVDEMMQKKSTLSIEFANQLPLMVARLKTDPDGAAKIKVANQNIYEIYAYACRLHRKLCLQHIDECALSMKQATEPAPRKYFDNQVKEWTARMKNPADRQIRQIVQQIVQIKLLNKEWHSNTSAKLMVRKMELYTCDENGDHMPYDDLNRRRVEDYTYVQAFCTLIPTTKRLTISTPTIPASVCQLRFPACLLLEYPGGKQLIQQFLGATETKEFRQTRDYWTPTNVRQAIDLVNQMVDIRKHLEHVSRGRKLTAAQIQCIPEAQELQFNWKQLDSSVRKFMYDQNSDLRRCIGQFNTLLDRALGIKGVQNLDRDLRNACRSLSDITEEERELCASQGYYLPPKY